MGRRQKIAAALTLTATAACTAIAIAADEPQTLPSVQVTAIKDAEVFNIPRSVELMQLFESIPVDKRNRVRLSFYVQTRSGEPLPADLKVTLLIRDDERALTLLPSGELVFPPLSEDDAKEAVIAANVRKGTIRITYYVQPRIGDAPTRLGDLRAAMKQARPAWAKLYGAAIGWTVPVFTCVRAYYATPSMVAMRSSDQAPVWRSASTARVVTVPLDQSEQPDELIVDWGAALPGRVGGCVAERRDGPNQP